MACIGISFLYSLRKGTKVFFGFKTWIYALDYVILILSWTYRGGCLKYLVSLGFTYYITSSFADTVVPLVDMVWRPSGRVLWTCWAHGTKRRDVHACVARKYKTVVGFACTAAVFAPGERSQGERGPRERAEGEAGKGRERTQGE